MMMMIDIEEQSPKSPPSVSRAGSVREKLMDTLRSESEFEDFMAHLYREFSSETMLSVIELVQFKSFLKEYGQTTDLVSPTNSVDGEEIVFFNKMPSSSIVHEDTISMRDSAFVPSDSAGEDVVGQTSDEVTQKQRRRMWIAGTLYEKYIRRHCELEINISWVLRNRWQALDTREYPMDEMQELIAILDEVLEEMLKYIRQSYLRYDISRK